MRFGPNGIRGRGATARRVFAKGLGVGYHSGRAIGADAGSRATGLRGRPARATAPARRHGAAFLPVAFPFRALPAPPPPRKSRLTHSSTDVPPDQALRLAIEQHRTGRLGEAEAGYRAILQSDPACADAWHLLAAIRHAAHDPQAIAHVERAIALAPSNPRYRMTRASMAVDHGDLQIAEEIYRRVIGAEPAHAEAHSNLGNLLRQSGRLAEAVAHLRQAVAARTNFAEAHYNLAIALQESGLPADAEQAYREAIRARPDFAMAHCNLGQLLLNAHREGEAHASFQHAIACDPRLAQAHYNLGILALAGDRPADAVRSLRLAVELAPGWIDARYELAKALDAADAPEQAQSAYREVLSVAPHHAFAKNNLAVLLGQGGRTEEAIELYRAAIADDPQHVAAYLNLAVALEAEGSDESIPLYRKLLAVSPNHAQAHNNLAYALLGRGDFASAWQEYAWRLPTRPLHAIETGPAPAPLVLSRVAELGEAPALLLREEQGLGDTLFFLRFAPQLRDRGQRLLVSCDVRIGPMLARTGVFEQCVPPGAAPAGAEPVLVGDMPLLTGAGDASRVPPPLRVSPLPEIAAEMRQRCAALGPPPYIGVAWRAGTKATEFALHKEIALPDLAATLARVDATYLSLQRAPHPGETGRLGELAGRTIHDLSGLNGDLERMIAVLALLDDYIGVSSTSVHLLAAVGGRARVLVPHPPEWRWGRVGKISPWFPDFSVYRQHPDGRWQDAFAELAQDLGQRRISNGRNTQ